MDDPSPLVMRQDPGTEIVIGHNSASEDNKLLYLAALAVIPVALLLYLCYKKNAKTPPNQMDELAVPVAKRARSLSPSRLPMAVDISHVKLSELENHLDDTSGKKI